MDGCRQGLGKERNMMLGLASSREELFHEALIMLRDEERWCTKAAVTSNNLMIEEFLYIMMIYGKMLTT